MTGFRHYIENTYSIELDNYQQLHRFSVEQREDFWRAIIEFFEIKITGALSPAFTGVEFDGYDWFPNTQLNFAENLLCNGNASQPAVVSLREDGHRQELSYADLRSAVAQLQNIIKPHLSAGDVLAAYMPNISETLVAMLASTGLGGIFTSTSCDFGVNGVVERFSQSMPKVLIAAACYEYNGKKIDCLAKIRQVVEQVPSIEKVLIVDFDGTAPDISPIANAEFWNCKNTDTVEALNPEFVTRNFGDPLYIMYSSGTTGKPKCIVHSVGGTLLQHVKELGLHTDLTADKRILYFTTCGWMMWNWLVSSLFFGGTTILYEGSPAYPGIDRLLQTVATEKINIFGTSPKFLSALEDQKVDCSQLDLSSLETILSTGSPLLPELYDFVYQQLKPDVLLASIAGGTDILGCFFLGNPTLPVYRGDLQCAGLGMAVSSFNDLGEQNVGEQGELVCLKSFPSQPIGFLNDPDRAKINSAYFDHYPGVWHHGDFVQITTQGGARFFGRSDATLNPGGVRIGTSEIYQQTERLDYLEDSVAVGKQIDGDIAVMLYVKMVPEQLLSEERIYEIKQTIRANTTSRHVPAQVIAVPDIPYTRSGKKMELAVARLINGQTLANLEAVANPECLKYFSRQA